MTAAKHDPATVKALLATLMDCSLPALELRFLALASWPETNPAFAAAALGFFTHFPVRFREQMGTAVAALGVAWRHRVSSRALAKVKAKKTPNAEVTKWLAVVPSALAVARQRETPSPPPGERVGERGPELAKAPRAAAQAAWLKRAEHCSVDDLPVLLERLADAPGTDVTERAVALLHFPTDARIGDAAAQLLARPVVRVSAEVALYSVVALLLAVHGDATHRKAVEGLVKQVQAFTWLEAALPTGTSARAPPPKKTGGPSSEADFLRFIAESPTDHARVALFTDWALEQGLPRGEFMALQRAEGDLTPKDMKRLGALQKKHEKEWLGSLARGAHKGSAVFRRGLLRELRLHLWGRGEWPREDEPLLATIESLSVEGGQDFVVGASWRSLRSLTAPERMLEQVPTELLERLEALGVMEQRLGDERKPLALFSARRLTKLHTLHLEGQWWSDPSGVEKLPQLKQLERLVVETTEPTKWFAFAKRVPRLDVVPGYEPEFRFAFHFEDGRLRAVSCAAPKDVEEHLFALLAKLPASVRRGALVEGATLSVADQERFATLC